VKTQKRINFVSEISETNESNMKSIMYLHVSKGGPLTKHLPQFNEMQTCDAEL
jgi:hypothetical protein